MTEPFVVSHRVEFRDTDAAGIMHFSAFITYMEESEHAFLRSLGLSVMECEVGGLHLSWPRVSTRCDYQRPLRFEQLFEVRVSLSKLGRKSVTYQHQFFHDNEQCAQGEITAVCCQIDGKNLQSVTIPDELRMKFQPFVSE